MDGIDDDCQSRVIPLPKNKTEMKTFILKWDPEGSAYSLVDFQKDFPNLEYGAFRWVVEEPDGIRSGDNFYMVKTGRGRCGIVMKGFFTSEPYPKKKGSSSCVVDLRPTCMIHPDNPKGILSLDALKSAIPDFPWEDGVSGRLLSRSQAEIVNRMWEQFIKGYDNCDFDGILADRNRRPPAGIDDAVGLAADVLYDREDRNGEPLILKSLRSGLNGSTIEEKIRGFLLEVIADREWSAGALRERGFSEAVVEGLLP